MAEVYTHREGKEGKIAEELGVWVMSREKRLWQDLDYVLGYFGKIISDARRAYLSFVKAGLGQGREASLLLGGVGSGDTAF